MPERSIAYANMRRGLLACVGQIPFGQVIEIATLAEALNIPARHAAHILSRLSRDEAEMLPWHRVIPRGGVFTRAKMERGQTSRQIALLRDEGVAFNGPGADRHGRGSALAAADGTSIDLLG